MDVSDRRMQVQLTPEAKIASDFLFIRAIFAFVGFVSTLMELKIPLHRLCQGRRGLAEVFSRFWGMPHGARLILSLRLIYALCVY